MPISSARSPGGKVYEVHIESLSNNRRARIRQPRCVRCNGRISSAGWQFCLEHREPAQLLGEFTRSLGTCVVDSVGKRSLAGWHLFIDHCPRWECFSEVMKSDGGVMLTEIETLVVT